MKNVAAWGVDLLVRRRNDALRNYQVSLVRTVQGKLHDNDILVELHVVKLTKHVGKGGGVNVKGVADVLSVTFLSCGDVMQLIAFREEGQQFGSIFSCGFS